MLEILASRRAGSICPSEIARQLEPTEWRALMEPVRRAARRLAHDGRLEITQRGAVVDPADFRGPVRLRIPSGVRS
ncbi:MAG: DUF3253 domain-containing protein [Planctomycetes bacterium]|nr:DUF3253 domain-containing protein [Planctomycetota bacterium]